jgi:shikimate 5-dehydrogenase
MTLETNPNAQVPVCLFFMTSTNDPWPKLANVDNLRKVLIQRPIAHLLSDATYIIAGGSGGLGIALARWMLQRGAKHIALLSRSPRSKPGVTRLEKEMNINGAHLTIIACDITDEQEVHAAIAQIGSSHPPVKGIIQAAMVLAVSFHCLPA